MLSLVISRERLERFVLCHEFVVDDQNMLIVTRGVVVSCGEFICSKLSMWYDSVVIQCHRLLLCVWMVPLWYSSVRYNHCDIMSWLNGTCRCDSVIWVDCTVRQQPAHHWHLLKDPCPIGGDSHSAQNWYDIFRNDHQKFSTQVFYFLNEWNANTFYCDTILALQSNKQPLNSIKSVKTSCVLTLPCRLGLAKVRCEVLAGLLSATHVVKGFYFMHASFTVTACMIAIVSSKRTIFILLVVTRVLPPVKKWIAELYNT